MNKHFTSVDQSDRLVPYNLRQSGATPVEMLIFTRVRKSPFWHLAVEEGCWRATVYNRIFHPFGYVRRENGGAMVEYQALKNHVTLWDVAVERQIMVKGPDAEKFVDYVITRDATQIKPMRAIRCFASNGIVTDTKRIGKFRIEVRLQEKFPKARGRINCTMAANNNRWRWFGKQFVTK